jgi:hypothetical protein
MVYVYYHIILIIIITIQQSGVRLIVDFCGLIRPLVSSETSLGSLIL